MAFLGGAGLVAYLYFFLIPFPLVRLASLWHQTVGTLTHYDWGEMLRFAAGVVSLFVLYLLGLHSVRRVDANSRMAWLVVILGGLGFSLILLFTYPVFSTDVFDNIMHGRILGHYGANPFNSTPAAFPADPFYKHVMWYDDPSAYGPLWEMVASALSLVAGDGLVTNVLLFKGVSVLAYVVDGMLVFGILRQMAPGRTLTGVYLYAWNPLVLLMSAGDGHNDSVMMIFVLGGIYLALRGRWELAVLAQAAGALTKFVPAVFLPMFLAAGLWEAPRPRRWRFLLTTVGLSALLAIVSYLPFLGGEDLLGINRRHELMTSSAPALLYLTVRDWLGRSPAYRVVARWALSGLAFLVWSQVPTLRRNRPLSLVRAACVVLLGYLLAFCPWFWPWYLVWIVPLAALLPAGVLRRGVVLFSFTAVWRPLILVYWRELFGLPNHPWRQIGLVAVTLFAPWLYFGYHQARRRLSAKRSPEWRLSIGG